MTCPACGADVPEGARYCPGCGVPLAAAVQTQERRMVSVLFADLADSTALINRLDPERAREVLAEFYAAAGEELIALRGRPEKFIGDAVMAVFGLPGAHEDDALRAVRAGLAIRGRTRRLAESLPAGAPPLRVRVGVQSGEVAVGAGPAGQLLVTGPAVNEAVRLQAAAAPGEILAGATTYLLTRDTVLFAGSREVNAKGFDRPLSAHLVQTLTTSSARRTIPLVGRQSELALLRDTLDRVRCTGRPHLFTLLGEAGIGKSRLVEELAAGAEPGARIAVGRIQPADWSPGYSPLPEMLAQLTSVDVATPQRVLPAAAAVLRQHRDPATAREVVDGLAAAFGEPDGDVDRTGSGDQVSRAFRILVHALSGEGPLVLAFDGIEHAGTRLGQLIGQLPARTQHERPVLVLAVGRDTAATTAAGWARAAENQTVLRLSALSMQESVELARQASAGRLDNETASAIAWRAGGNPFFVIESTGMLLDRGPVPAGGLGLPPSIQAVIASRLDHLPGGLRRLARVASVYFGSFDVPELRLVHHAEAADLRGLEQAEVLQREAGADRWAFRHELLRDVAYASLTKRDRQRLHLAVAEGLAGEGSSPRVAEHLAHAAEAALDLDPGDRTLAERAVEALRAAADRARRGMENRVAAALAERALRLAGPADGWGRREGRLLAGLGEARYWLGEFPAARAALADAERLAGATGDDGYLALVLRLQGDIRLNTDNDVPGAQALFHQALAAAERSGDDAVLTRTLLFAGWAPWNAGDFTTAERLFGRALRLARETGDGWAEVRALTSLSVCADEQGDPRRTHDYAQQAQELAGRLGDRFSTAVAGMQVARSLMDEQRFDEALGHIDASLAVFEDLDARWEHADALRTRGVLLREQGRLAEAESDLLAALGLSEQLGEKLLTTSTWRALARVAEGRGDRVTAAERRRLAAEAAAAPSGDPPGD